MAVSRLTLHETGPECSRLALGFWRLGEWNMRKQDIRALLHACLEMGITTLDHADIYGDYACQGLFGAALAEEPGLRDCFEIVGKCGIQLLSPNRPAHRLKHYDTSRAHILASVDNSLRELRCDYLDLLLIHRPDPLMDADEVASAFCALRASGKVRHFGVSNFGPSQLELLASRLDFPLVTNQIEISVLKLDTMLDGTLDQCQRLRIAPMAWSPLGGGRLFDGKEERVVRVRTALSSVVEEISAASLDQAALAFLLTHPARIVPVVGSSKITRLRTAAAADAMRLTRQQWFSIWRESTGRDVP
jgi:predicted oxidoreductase